MKLALLTPHISRRGGGIKDAVLGLACSLTHREDVQLNVLSVEDEFSAKDRVLWDSIPIHLFSSPMPGNFRYAPELAQFLFSLNPDVVHTHGLWTYLSLASLKFARTGVSQRPYVVSPHGMLDPWALRNSFVKKRLAALAFERRHLTNAACLHAVSKGEAETFRAYGLANPICVIPNGVGIPRMDSDGLQVPWNAESTNGRKVLLYLGRLHPKKGLPAFLRAWQQTSKKSGWILVIAGWDQGGHRSKLEELVNELAILDSVRFLGPLLGAQRDAAYQYADAFVLPSLSEGQPLAVLEAWSHALPVLMTPNCNLDEGFVAGAAIRMELTIESEVNGLQMLFSLSETALREMGIKGQNLVKSNFSWPQIAAEIASVYYWMTEGGPMPRSVITS